MALMKESTSIVTLPEYDLFGLPPVQTTVESTVQTEHRPISVLNSGGHINFVIPTSANEFILPAETTLNVKLRIILSKSDKSQVVASDWNHISIVNNFLSSLWQQVNVSIGDTQITTSNQTYSLKCYMETMMNYSDEAKKSYLSSSGWFTDELWDTPHKPNLLRSKYIRHITPPGIEEDKDKDFAIGKIYDLYGKLNWDLSIQNRALLGGIRMTVQLDPNPIDFFLICSDEKLIPRIEFTEVTLNIVRAKISPQVVFAIEKGLERAPTRYPFPRNEVKTTTINAGTLNYTIDNVIIGQLPRKCYISFISNESFTGSLKKNPYYFHHYNCNFIACYVNSVQYPMRAYQPDFDNGLYTREYIELFRTMNQFGSDVRMTFSLSEYAKGRTIFGFNFSPDLSDGCGTDNYISPTNKGSLRIEVHFKKPLPETINVLIRAEYDNLIMIPEDRNAILDYH